MPPPPPPLRRVNPFGDRGRLSPDRFWGRNTLLRRIFEELRKGSSLSLVGESQIGKSSLLGMVSHQGPTILEVEPAQVITIDMQIVRNEAEFFEALCGELQIETCRGFRLARTLKQQHKRYIVCLDEIEKMVNPRNFTGDEREELRGLADGADAPLSLVIASRSPLHDLFDDDPSRTSPLHGLCGAPLRVPGFTPAETTAFITHRLAGNAIQFTPDQIKALYAQTKGHPARLQAAAAGLYRRLENA